MFFLLLWCCCSGSDRGKTYTHILYFLKEMRMSKRVSWLVESSSIALLLVLCCYVWKVANGMERKGVKGQKHWVLDEELHKKGGVQYWVLSGDFVKETGLPHRKVVGYGALEGTLGVAVEDDKKSGRLKEKKRVYGCGWEDEHVLAIIMEGGEDGEACELLLGRMKVDSGMPINLPSSVFENEVEVKVMGQMGVQATMLAAEEWDDASTREHLNAHSCTISYTMLTKDAWNTFWANAKLGRKSAILYSMLPSEQWQALGYKLPKLGVGKFMKVLVDDGIHLLQN